MFFMFFLFFSRFLTSSYLSRLCPRSLHLDCATKPSTAEIGKRKGFAQMPFTPLTPHIFGITFRSHVSNGPNGLHKCWKKTRPFSNDLSSELNYALGSYLTFLTSVETKTHHKQFPEPNSFFSSRYVPSIQNVQAGPRVCNKTSATRL